jgi:bud site selection protein 31
MTSQFDWLVRDKVADGSLIAKWRKPGYEILCSMLAIQKGNHNFGTTSHCRVPIRQRAQQQKITPNIGTGCISCCSGDGKFGGPLWWNTPVGDDDKEDDKVRFFAFARLMSLSNRRGARSCVCVCI